MGLVKAKSKKLSFFQRRIQSETAHMILTVHDEIDYLTDFSILKPLTKKLSQYLDISVYYKKFNVPYIRYLFDIEYDEWGAWTAGKSVDVYQMPISREEKIAIDAYTEAVTLLKGSVAEEQEKTDIIRDLKIDFTSENNNLSVEDFVAKLENLPCGATTLRVKVSEKKCLKFYKSLEQSALINLVNELEIKIID